MAQWKIDTGTGCFPISTSHGRSARLRLTQVLSLPAVALVGSCALFYPPGYNPPPGLIYQNTSMNHQIDTPTDLGNKSGSACVTGFFWLVSTGNASVQAAAASKGIRTIKAVDYQITSFLGGVFNRVCTVVHGE